MSMSEPRLRTLLRQANKSKEAGKRAAAEQVYREILAEAPENVEAWLGLAEVSNDAAEREQAYQRVLELDVLNEVARAGLAGEPLPTPEVPPPPPPPPAPAPEKRPSPTAVTPPSAPPDPPAAEETTLFCYRHPQRETALRCYNCNQPICIECANKTPVGYICPTCRRDLEKKFFSATPVDYIIAGVVSFILSLLAGFVVVNFGGGFFWVLIIFFIGGAVGSFIARLTNRAIGRRRGRYIPHLVATMIILGVAIPAFPLLLVIILGQPGALLRLLVPGIYAFIASSAAFYWMR